MSKKGIFYMARPISGSDGIRMLQHLKILEVDNDIVDHLSYQKTQKGKEIIQGHSNLKIRNSINMFIEDYHNKYKHMKSWNKVYECLDVSQLKEYDSLYIMGGSNYRASGFCRGGREQGRFPNCSSGLKFVSHGVHHINILALLKAHREYGIPLHEYVYDTDELSCCLFHESVAPLKKNYYAYYGHAVEKYGYKRLDCHQYYFENVYRSPLFKQDKIYDMTSGYTNCNDTRDRYSIEMNKLAKNCKTSNIYIKDPEKNINTFLDKDTYNDKLLQSRFTFVFPAYDLHVVSIDRIIGALQRDCLTLFHSECNVEDIQKSFDVDLTELFTTELFSEEKRLELLEYLKSKILPYKVGFVKT